MQRPSMHGLPFSGEEEGANVHESQIDAPFSGGHCSSSSAHMGHLLHYPDYVPHLVIGCFCQFSNYDTSV